MMRIFCWTSVLSLTLTSAALRKAIIKLQDTDQRVIRQTYDDGYYTSHRLQFVANGDFTVTDQVTSLMWQQNDSSSNITKSMSWNTAISYCKTLRLASYSNWRLPTAQELFNMFNVSKPNFPSPMKQIADSPSPIYYWANTTGSQGSDYRWEVNSGGGTGSKPMNSYTTETFKAKCVRTVTPATYTLKRYTKINAYKVFDNSTGLTWQLVDVDPQGNLKPMKPQQWSTALTYCHSLSSNTNFAGFEWRLPNIKELYSLVETSLYGPAINTTVFWDVKSTDQYWSSTTETGNTKRTGNQYSWYVDFTTGLTTYAISTTQLYTRCVTGGR